MIHGLFVDLCLLIDNMLYGINTLLFNVFLEVAEARFKEGIFDDFVKNLYVIIGIFMVFRVAFSLIQMLANPDMLADKEKGAGKLATRIVIAFGLIIMVPTIFDYAYKIQTVVLQENILGRLILGDSGAGNNNSSNKSSIVSQGQIISSSVFKNLIEVPEGLTGNKVNECKGYLDMNSGLNTVNELKDTGCFDEKVNDKYVYDYKFLVSSLALGMVAWLMVGYCIDIGVRLVKLTFLQLLAPVCIVTYVGGSKDNAFNKWLKMTISAFLSVFIKLIIIYFVIYLIGRITDTQYGLTLSGLGKVLVILGLLVFAKNAPKLIGDLFGIKMDEESGFKGIAKTALLGGAALAAGGALGGASNLVKGAGDAWKNAGGLKGLKTADGWKKFGSGALGAIGSGIAGTTAGAFYGAKHGFGKNATLGGSVNKALMTSRTNRDNRDDRAKVYGSGARAFWYGNFVDRALGFAGIDTQAKKIVNQHKNHGQVLDRRRMNAAHDQQQLFASMNDAERITADRFVFDAFSGDKGTWTEFNDRGEIVGTWDYATQSSDFDTHISGYSNDVQRYINDTRDIAQLDREIIENNKAMGKAETQQKKMEGSNGNK